MSVAGFIAAMGGAFPGGGQLGQSGRSAWMPGVSSPFLDNFELEAGTSQSAREQQIIGQSGSGDFEAYTIGPATINRKYMVLAYITSHADGSPNDGIRGLYLAYFSVDSAGNIVFNGDDETFLKQIGAITSITGLGIGSDLVIRVSNSSALVAIPLSIYMTTIELIDPGVVTSA